MILGQYCTRNCSFCSVTHHKPEKVDPAEAVRVAEANIGVKGSTIQKLLGLRPNLDLKDFDINNPQFDPLGNVYIKNYKLIIVDEASMINRSLYNFIKAESKKYNVKILYVGRRIADFKLV